jgi:hypothetical protein
VKSYRTDNGIYTTKEFLESLVNEKQVISHSGVGGHHHNGAAKNAIKHTTYKARTMMIHQALRWPDASDKTLWPLALDHAVYLHNHTPNPALGGLTPEEIWSKSVASHSTLLHAHVWGCPAYVLNPRLTDGKKIPKWQPRSRRGMYVDRSSLHASLVGLILNLQSSNISPQYHVVYDDFYETVHLDEASEPECWGDLILTSSERVVIDEATADEREKIPRLAGEWTELQTKLHRSQDGPFQQREQTLAPEHRSTTPAPSSPSGPQSSQSPTQSVENTSPRSPITPDPRNPSGTQPSPSLPQSVGPTRRSTRQRYIPDRMVPGQGGMESPKSITTVLA